MDKRAGRNARTSNRAKREGTVSLLDAILTAAAQVGEDLKGKDGIVGYMRRLAIKDQAAFAKHLGPALLLESKRPRAATQSAPPITKSMSAIEASAVYQRTLKEIGYET